MALPYFIDRKCRFHEPLYTLCTLLTMKPALLKVYKVGDELSTGSYGHIGEEG